VPPPQRVARERREKHLEQTRAASVARREKARSKTSLAGDVVKSAPARGAVQKAGLMSGVSMGKSRQGMGIGQSWWLGPSGKLTTRDLRRGVILSEIFQPPLSMRDM
jgi:hypothetical protein